MKIKSFALALCICAFAPLCVFAAAPASNMPGYDPNIPVLWGSGSNTPLVPLPPHLPEYLPNGAINLDEVWTEDGGARLYWNALILPQQLKMGGATWIDPALVPLLVTEKQPTTYRRWRRRPARRVKTPAPTVQAPAIPLPVTPVEPAVQATVKPAPAKRTVARRTRAKAPASRVVRAPQRAAAPAGDSIPPLTSQNRSPQGVPGIPIVQENTAITPPRLQ